MEDMKAARKLSLSGAGFSMYLGFPVTGVVAWESIAEEGRNVLLMDPPSAGLPLT